jgi:hypothetical protein
MTTLILSGRYTPESIALWKSAKPPEWRVERIPQWQVPKLDGDDFAVYGEPLFAAHVCSELGLSLLEPRLDWIAKLPAELRNRNIQYTTLVEARTIQKASFIKPADNKIFEARVYANGAELPPAGIFPENEPVLIAEPVPWDVEFRCFVLDGNVQTLSPYWRNGHSAQTDEEQWPANDEETEAALAFAGSVLTSHRDTLPPAVVLDVGVIRDRGWSVVEANPAWASGFYGCEAEQILPVLKRCCHRKSKLTKEDQRWVLERTKSS